MDSIHYAPLFLLSCCNDYFPMNQWENRKSVYKVFIVKGKLIHIVQIKLRKLNQALSLGNFVYAMSKRHELLAVRITSNSDLWSIYRFVCQILWFWFAHRKYAFSMSFFSWFIAIHTSLVLNFQDLPKWQDYQEQCGVVIIEIKKMYDAISRTKIRISLTLQFKNGFWFQFFYSNHIFTNIFSRNFEYT